MTRRSGADEAGPANKRPKLEESDSGPPESRQPTQDAFGPRHDSLWLKDGSVIIAAVDLSFKVHSSVLGRHSSVFRELLDETGATGSAETFEGCRVLRVTDKGSTLADFLKILYDSGSRCVDTSSRAGPFLKLYKPFPQSQWRYPVSIPARGYFSRHKVQGTLYRQRSHRSPRDSLPSFALGSARRERILLEIGSWRACPL